MTQSRLRANARLDNYSYYLVNRPNWWASLDAEDSDGDFRLDIPPTRADRPLDCVVNVPAGTTVYLGLDRSDRIVPAITSEIE